MQRKFGELREKSVNTFVDIFILGIFSCCTLTVIVEQTLPRFVTLEAKQVKNQVQHGISHIL